MAGAALATSFSRLAEYAACPLRYRYLHVDRVPEPEVEPDWSRAPRIAPTLASTFDLVLGRVIHASLRAWQAEVDGGGAADAERLLGDVRSGALAVGLDRARLDAAMAREASGLRAYAEGPWPRRRTLFSEHPARLDLRRAGGVVRVDLRLDRVTEYRGGSAIVDFKSVPPHAVELRADRWQLRTYALALPGLRPRPKAPVALFILDVRAGRQLRVDGGAAVLASARGRLLSAIAGVAAGRYGVAGHPARPCWSCGYRLGCPASLSPRPSGRLPPSTAPA